MYGPYAIEQLRHLVAEGRVRLDWRARRGSGKVVTVREAVGREFCEHLARGYADRREAEAEAAPSEAALIECSACGREVARSARKCPHCGAATPEHQKEKVRTFVAGGLLIALGALAWIAAGPLREHPALFEKWTVVPLVALGALSFLVGLVLMIIGATK